MQKQKTDEEKEKIEKLCLEHGMIKAQKHDEIPSNYEYTGFFAFKDLIGKDFADGRKRYFYFGYGSNIYIYAEALLICKGYDTNGFDGIYGVGTNSAVKSYQRTHCLNDDGIAGGNTFRSLCA